MKPKEERFGLTCPSCGTFIRVVGTVEEVPVKSDINEKDVLAIFSPSIKNMLDLKIEGNKVMIHIKGKYSSKKFSKAMAEVRGYGGQWVKGHFLLSVAALTEAGVIRK